MNLCGQTKIWEEYNVKVLRVDTDSKLSFNHRVSGKTTDTE